MKVCSQCQICLDDVSRCCPTDGAVLEKVFNGPALVDGKYSLEYRLGQGGMGAVYSVRHIGLDRRFALKLIHITHSNREALASRFEIEARALGRLKHEGIVDVTDYGVDPRSGGLPYLVMEHLQGQTLRELMQDSGALTLDRLMPLLDKIAEAIDFAHAQGITHCDLKPSNIFICPDGTGNQRAIILDFGLARLARVEDPQAPAGNAPAWAASESLAETIVASGTVETTRTYPHPGYDHSASDIHRGLAGTPAYMAPEVWSNNSASPAVDLYSFGVMIYQLVIGRVPFQGTPEAVRLGHLKMPPPRAHTLGLDLPREIEDVLLAPLEKNPSLRPKSAGDIVRTLRAARMRVRRKEWRTREIPRRAWIAAALAIAMGAAWGMLSKTSFVSGLEQRAIDPLFSIAPLHAPDPRILIINFDEGTLTLDPTPLSGKANEVGETLQRIYAAGAQGIAVDLLLPYSWSRSESFSRLVLRHADTMTLAVFANKSGGTIGTECINGLTTAALGAERSKDLFGFVNLLEDSDGIVRRAHLSYPRAGEGNVDSWATKAVRCSDSLKKLSRGAGEMKRPFWIDHSIDWQQIPRISWKDIASWLSTQPSIFQNRLVLVGSDYYAGGDDYHRVPSHHGKPEALSGVVLEAVIINTILSGLPIHELNALFGTGMVVLVCFVAALGGLCLPRITHALSLLLLLILACVAGAMITFRFNGLLIPGLSTLIMAVFVEGIALLLCFRLARFPSFDEEES